MILKILSYFTLTFLAQSLYAQVNRVCEAPMNLENFEAMVETVRQSYFPELREVHLEVSTFESQAYFLQAQPVIISLLRKRSKRRYQVQLNTKLLACPPTITALEAILIHELEHVVDYLPMSAPKVATFGWRYLMHKKFKRHYERSTDCKVLERGFHFGLSEYRIWLYQWLNPRDLITKKKTYLTPEEIEIFRRTGKCKA